ncbi:MAG: hypothetical protein Q8P72_03295 [Candidatus Roizmanbacteria bacterium]|nr:hypothetical protein [Candidatus Roizmanbacteria bacterium]
MKGEKPKGTPRPMGELENYRLPDVKKGPLCRRGNAATLASSIFGAYQLTTSGGNEMSSHEKQTTKSFLNTEAIVLGVLLGGLLTGYAGWAILTGQHLLHSPVEETLWTALFLTFLVGYVQFSYPTMFTSRPRLAIFALCFLAGHISLFFDSFAVILLFSTLTFNSLARSKSGAFNAFSVKSIAAFNALTVGGGFYLGELWGLPYYISSHMDFPIAGLPLLIVLTPYCALTSFYAAKQFPVKVDKVPFDRQQMIKAVEFAAFLILLIWTHSPFLCIGLLLMYSAIRGKTQILLHNGLLEIREGAASALSLIVAALIIQQIPGTQEWIAVHVHGPWIMLLAAVSSPFAGAMVPGVSDPSQFYLNLTWIMLGAPLLVSSSLVAIVVFKEQLAFSDLPRWMQQLPWMTRRGAIQEAEAYTMLMVPLTAGLAIFMFIGHYFDIFAKSLLWLQGG